MRGVRSVPRCTWLYTQVAYSARATQHTGHIRAQDHRPQDKGSSGQRHLGRCSVVVVVSEGADLSHVSNPPQHQRGGLDSHRSRAHRLFRHAVHFQVHRIGHKPVALRLAHRPARQHTIQALSIGIDPPPRRPGVPADESEVARLLAESLVGRGLEAGFGLVANLAGVLLDAGPVALDEVELGVVLGQEDEVVAPRRRLEGLGRFVRGVGRAANRLTFTSTIGPWNSPARTERRASPPPSAAAAATSPPSAPRQPPPPPSSLLSSSSSWPPPPSNTESSSSASLSPLIWRAASRAPWTSESLSPSSYSPPPPPPPPPRQAVAGRLLWKKGRMGRGGRDETK